jgi:hypothetical protein
METVAHGNFALGQFAAYTGLGCDVPKQQAIVESNSVFISYRRETSDFVARAVFLSLKQHGYDVFMDVESIAAGKFDTIILEEIAARPYFLLILTPNCLTRCKKVNDWLRREIEQALSTERIIVPVTAHGFDYTEIDEYLPHSVATELRRFNGLDVSHLYFTQALDRLCSQFLLPTSVPIRGTSKAHREEITQIERKALSLLPETELKLEILGKFMQSWLKFEQVVQSASKDRVRKQGPVSISTALNRLLEYHLITIAMYKEALELIANRNQIVHGQPGYDRLLRPETIERVERLTIEVKEMVEKF